ncbi:hypothetical protein N9L68_08620 [bacterium]|nr:hypothetical protein [bacterium]
MPARNSERGSLGSDGQTKVLADSGPSFLFCVVPLQPQALETSEGEVAGPWD